MIYCGLKLTHDSSIAVIDNNVLVGCIELEKVNNNSRYKIIDDLSQLPVLLSALGYSMKDIDAFVVDGWIGKDQGKISVTNNNISYNLNVSGYHESAAGDVFMQTHFDNLKIDSSTYSYHSYSHVVGHILSAYCTSPFAKRNEDSFVLVWDGGMYPRLYHISANDQTVKPKCILFHFAASIYSIFSQHYGPFKINENVIKDELSIAGKIMAYTAFGKRDGKIIQLLEKTYIETYSDAIDENQIAIYPYLFTKYFKKLSRDEHFYDEDILTSFHYFIQELICKQLHTELEKEKHPVNLCFGGGAALNIKWNSQIRNLRTVKELWICPFPNDSGSAIGTALTHYFIENKESVAINWNVYSGPSFIINEVPENWNKRNCSIEDLAALLFEQKEPVMILDGKAELGPRALGNRSILSSASETRFRDKINNIKFRESYRPVAPICIEELAPVYFEPGTPDPYMLFEHYVKPNKQHLLEAVCHKDNSARLQTVNSDNNPILYDLLSAYYALSGIPALCNSSANFKGSGFFADLFSATRWNMINYIWCNDILYYK